MKQDEDNFNTNKLRSLSTDLYTLKSDIDKLDVHKLKIVATDFKNWFWLNTDFSNVKWKLKISVTAG